MSTAQAEVIQGAARATAEVEHPAEVERPAAACLEYPRIPTTCDGAEAVVHVETRISQAAGAYPITSSTTMGGGLNAAMMNGQVNLWGDELMFFPRKGDTIRERLSLQG